MVRYMIAMDGSKTAEGALRYVVNKLLDKQKDELYLVTVTEKITHRFPSAPGFVATVIEAQKSMERETEKSLRRWGKQCHEWGVKNVFAVRGTAPHAGELICQACDKKAIDVLIIGRRGMSGIKRLFLGSTSRYCVEHANCSVLVIKQDEKKEKEEETTQQQEKFQSDLNRNISRMAEEGEKLRIKEEETKEEEETKKRRDAEHIEAVVEEEAERRRRIAEERIIEDRHFHVEDMPYEALPHIEDPHDIPSK